MKPPMQNYDFYGRKNKKKSDEKIVIQENNVYP